MINMKKGIFEIAGITFSPDTPIEKYKDLSDDLVVKQECSGKGLYIRFRDKQELGGEIFDVTIMIKEDKDKNKVMFTLETEPEKKYLSRRKRNDSKQYKYLEWMRKNIDPDPHNELAEKIHYFSWGYISAAYNKKGVADLVGNDLTICYMDHHETEK